MARIKRNNNNVNNNSKINQEAIENMKRNQLKKESKKRQKTKKFRPNARTVLEKFGYTSAKKSKVKATQGTTLQLYFEMFANWLRHGWQRSNVPDHHIPFNKFYYSSNKIYTSDAVKIPYILAKWETQTLPIGWVSLIRQDLEKVQNDYNTAHDTHYTVTFNHITECEKTKIKAFSSNETYKNNFNNLRREYEKNLMELDNPDINKAQKAQHIGEEQYKRLTSYEWLMDLEDDKDSSLWSTFEFCEVNVFGDDGLALNELAEKACNTVIARFNYFKIKVKDLMMTIQEYYDSQSFIGHAKKKSFIRKRFPAETRESSYLTSGSILQEGNVSDLVGVPVGVDMFNQKPIFIDYTDNSLAVNTLIAGTTGSGKTFYIQTVITGLLQFPQFYFPIVIDVKNEYRAFAKNLEMQFISLAPSEGIYIDTMVIPEPTGDKKIDVELKEDALRDTEAIFEILLGEAWKDINIQSAFNFVRNSLYRKRGVVLNNPDTWKNSRGLTFHSFYDEISKVMQDSATQASESAGGSLAPYQKMKMILGEYFEIDGSKSSYFQHAISLNDIDESKGVVFGLGQNVATTNNNDERLQLSIMFVMHLLKALTVKIKRKKRLLMTFFEETNQLLLMPHIADLLSRFASGGRSFGMRNFFITNAPKQIFSASEFKNKNSDINLSAISAFESNIGGLVVGSLKMDDMKVIYHKMLEGKNNVQIFLKLLVAESSSGGKSSMRHAFVLLHRKKTALIQALANPDLIGQGLFGSEVNVKSRYDKEIDLEDLLEERDNDNGLEEYVKMINKKSNEIKEEVNVNTIKPDISSQSKNNLFVEQDKQHGAHKLRNNYNHEERNHDYRRNDYDYRNNRDYQNDYENNNHYNNYDEKNYK